VTKLIRMTATQYDQIRNALFPGDGLEAVAFALSGRCASADRDVFLVRSVATIPPPLYLERSPDRVRWRTEVLPPLLDRATQEGLSFLKVHSHPGGCSHFSHLDDASDRALAESVAAWTGGAASSYLSALVLPDDRVHARKVSHGLGFEAIQGVDRVGDDLEFDRRGPSEFHGFGAAFRQAFGAGTFAYLRQLRIAVVGCSGTGSIVVEQLARNGVGSLILVDPDLVEGRNLDRILHATIDDAREGRPKVEVLKRAIEAIGTGTQVTAMAINVFTPSAVRAVASADVVFGCVDNAEARHLLSRLAAFYVLPYFDLGVKLEADGSGRVTQVCGGAHYLRPGGSSLLSRGLYTIEDVRSAALLREDPSHHADLLARGYIRGAAVARPAVISVNMLIAALAVNDFLARLHPYRLEPNSQYAAQRVSLSHGLFEPEAEGEPCSTTGRNLGRGDVVPLLDLPELSES
jgi:hypothetical protein